MKQFSPRISIYDLRVFSACLLSFLILTAPIAPLAGATNGASPIKSSQYQPRQREDQTREKLSPNPLVNPLSPPLPTITATLADDIGLGSKKNPGATITYTAVISDASADATGVTFTDILDANTTQTGTVNVSPVTVNDTYPQTVIGNVSINSALIPFSVLTNDYLG